MDKHNVICEHNTDVKDFQPLCPVSNQEITLKRTGEKNVSVFHTVLRMMELNRRGCKIEVI